MPATHLPVRSSVRMVCGGVCAGMSKHQLACAHKYACKYVCVDEHICVSSGGNGLFIKPPLGD